MAPGGQHLAPVLADHLDAEVAARGRRRLRARIAAVGSAKRLHKAAQGCGKTAEQLYLTAKARKRLPTASGI